MLDLPDLLDMGKSLFYLPRARGYGKDSPTKRQARAIPRVGLSLSEMMRREAEQKAKRKVMLAEREEKKIARGRRKRALRKAKGERPVDMGCC